MPTVSALNDGTPRFTATFLPTGATVLADPPANHGGTGTSFAPTDLLDAALLACTGATLQMKAQSLGLDTKGIKLTSSHTMAESPRRLGAFDIQVELPFTPDERQKRSLIAAAKACPVRNSLREDTAIKLTFKWADGQSEVVEK